MKIQYRIVEKVYKSGKKLFYPQKYINWFIGWRYYDYLDDVPLGKADAFYCKTLKEAKEWLRQEIETEKIKKANKKRIKTKIYNI